MKTASKLLTIVVLLGFVKQAGAESYGSDPDYTILIGRNQFGFADDWHATATPFRPERHPKIYLGPLGSHDVPFTATQGLVGVCIIVAVLIIVPAVLAVRWKKKRAVQ